MVKGQVEGRGVWEGGRGAHSPHFFGQQLFFLRDFHTHDIRIDVEKLNCSNEFNIFIVKNTSLYNTFGLA